MINLLYKEFRLAAHPTSFLFLMFGAMLLIPSYPFYVAFFYPCLAVFFVFIGGRENKDIFYTVSLPLKKSDVVKARCGMIAALQLLQIILSVPFALLRGIIPGIGENQAGIEANAAFFGLAFVFLAIFNCIFIPKFYATGYKAGMPFILASIGMTVFFVLAEALVWIPSPLSDYLDTSEPSAQPAQLSVLAAGIAIWAAAMFFTYKKAAKNFEKVDL